MFSFHKLTRERLEERFECKKSHTSYGYKMEASSILIDIESFKGNNDFRKLLGYINTAEEKQQKGEGGSVR